MLEDIHGIIAGEKKMRTPESVDFRKEAKADSEPDFYGKWTPISELPEDRDTIDEDKITYKRYWVTDSSGYMWLSELHYYGSNVSPITYWMELPPPPKGE